MIVGTKSRKVRRGEQAWRTFVAGHERSGLSVQAYCERHGLNAVNFYRWRAKFDAPVHRSVTAVSAQGPAFIDAGPLQREVHRRAELDLRLDLGEGWVLHLVRR